ncbi:hypothetical protein COO60DRAFT_551069 [Scenedesmus sp. NREL 46B-D3]|nr:hypothetical protein COO60DRAFT_551069 [Scenedesmus sp. NREL 46B-D3]
MAVALLLLLLLLLLLPAQRIAFLDFQKVFSTFWISCTIYHAYWRPCMTADCVSLLSVSMIDVAYGYGQTLTCCYMLYVLAIWYELLLQCVGFQTQHRVVKTLFNSVASDSNVV